MPIDDALEKINTDKNPEPVKQSSKPAQEYFSKELNAKAEQIMGKFLVEYFSGMITGQSDGDLNYEIPDNCIQIIEKMGIYIFTLTPKKKNQNKLLFTQMNNLNKLNKDLLKEIITKSCGDYVFQTDIGSSIKKDSLETLLKFIPEFDVIKGILLDEKGSSEKDEARASIHPYGLVMGMDVKYRPFATLVVEKAIKSKSIGLDNEQVEEWYNNNKKEDFQTAIGAVTPPLKDFIETAKEHGVTEVLPVLKEFKKVCQSYINNWGK